MPSRSSPVRARDRDMETPQPLTTFRFFPRLPKEIRFMIWELSLPGPQIVHLEISRSYVRMGPWLRDWDARIGGPRPGGIKYRAEDFLYPNVPPTLGPYGEVIKTHMGSWTAMLSQRAPAMLFVSQESQHVGKKVYERVSLSSC